MIQPQSILKVADNSGAKTVKCIKILKTENKFASVGDCIIVSVRTLRSTVSLKVNRRSSKQALKKGQVYKALIIRTKKPLATRKYGFNLGFETNDVVLLNNQNNLIGSRIFGPVTKELRLKNFKKVISQSKRIL